MRDRLPEYVRYLLDAEIYPHPVKKVDLIQTHASFITLCGEFVYKWKKAVDFGFLDFTSLRKRRHFCEEELRLNRRLCPDIYLSLVRITRQNGLFLLDGQGEVVEYGIKMVRMREDRMMNRVIAAGQLTREHLAAIVNQLVPFYNLASSGESVRRYGRLETIAGNVHDNFTLTRRYVGGQSLAAKRFARISSYAERFLSQSELFQKRVEQGHIRECHGDLHSANICLEDKVHIFDCIEFNESLRCTDTAADVAFLAMDLDFHRLGRLSEYFIEYFIDRSGDEHVRDVLNFYKCYRAYVRGKISLLKADDPAVDPVAAGQAITDAAKYFELAEEYCYG